MSNKESAVERAKKYLGMSKQDLNAEYDRLRETDPENAAAEGLLMHKVFHKRPGYESLLEEPVDVGTGVKTEESGGTFPAPAETRIAPFLPGYTPKSEGLVESNSTNPFGSKDLLGTYRNIGGFGNLYEPIQSPTIDIFGGEVPATRSYSRNYNPDLFIFK